LNTWKENKKQKILEVETLYGVKENFKVIISELENNRIEFRI